MLIKNGFLIDPASDTERLVDLRITDGLIQTLADAGTLTPENGEDELDVAGLMISPGLVDTHIHFRDPGFTSKASRSISSLKTGTESMTGEVFAIQITEVNPPAAAARDPVWRSSL